MSDQMQKEFNPSEGATIHLRLPSFPQYVSLARLTVASVGNMIGFSVDDVEDLKVAVSEACTNALCHGNCDEACYDLYYTVEPERLTICVSDNGEGYEPESIADPEINCAGGFGLFIIKALMDEVRIVSSKGTGTSITMIKNLRD